ncbi:MAG: HD domain-containing protein, partial [candidate division WOR-3 bacterium]
MERNEALNLVREKVKNENLRKHMLATEACMRKLAKYFGEDEERWGLCGLLHDLDYDETAKTPEVH